MMRMTTSTEWNSGGALRIFLLSLALLGAVSAQSDIYLRIVVSVDEPTVALQQGNAQPLPDGSWDPESGAHGNVTGLAVSLLQYILAKANANSETFFNSSVNIRAYVGLASDNGGFGSYDNTTNSWSGAVGDVLAGRADLAVGAYTINQGRVRAGVHFSAPFMAAGMGILTRRSKDQRSYWLFTEPFTREEWACLFIGTLAACFSMWCMNRVSPYGFYRSVEPGNPERRTLNALNAGFIGIQVLLGKDAGIPKAWSSRIAMVMLIFLVFFVSKEYVANLTVILTVPATKLGVSSWEDLKRPDKTFAVLRGSAASAFFTTDAAWKDTAARNMLLCESTQECISMVRAGAVHAHVSDVPSIQYSVLEPPCNLVRVGTVLQTQFLAFMVNGSKFTSLDGIDHLQWMVDTTLAEAVGDGTISQLYDAYYNFPGRCQLDGDLSSQMLIDEQGVPRFPDGNDYDDSARITVQDGAGIGIVFISLLIVAAMAFLLEYCVSRLIRQQVARTTSGRSTPRRRASIVESGTTILQRLHKGLGGLAATFRNI